MIAICLIGNSKARFTILTPIISSLFKFNSSKTFAACNKVNPPPGITPSSTAAVVACKASSIFIFFSFNSVSVAAPTLITATPPDNFPSLFLKSSILYSLSSPFISDSICFILFSIADLLPCPSIITVSSFVTLIFFAVPKSSIFTSSILSSTSFEINLPFVKIAISCKISFFSSPNPGALTAQTFIEPLIKLITKVVNASPSISSAIIIKGLPSCETASKTGTNSLTVEIVLSVISMYGSS